MVALTALTARVRAVLARCPACGGDLVGRAGLEWMVCRACPLAVDPFESPPRRMQTWVLAEEAGSGGENGVQMPFYLFHFAGGLDSAWVHACRIVGVQTHGDPGARLTARRYLPWLVPGPLRVRLARGPGAALRLLRARSGLAPDAPLAVAGVQLVGLPARVEGNLLREPASGLVFPRLLVLPNPREEPRGTIGHREI